MVKYLSQEWFDQGRELDAKLAGRPGLGARVQYVVTDGPDGDIEYYWIFADGHLAESKIGRIPDPDVTITLSYADSVASHRGEIDQATALANGSIEGDVAVLQQLRSLRNDSAHDEAQAFMRSVTDY